MRRIGLSWATSPSAACQIGQCWVSCESVPRQTLFLGLLVIPGAARGTRVLQFDKRSGVFHTSLNHQRLTKSPTQTQKCMQTEWRDELAPTFQAHISSRAFPREMPVRGRFFSNAVFNQFPLEDFSQTNGN